MSIPYPISPIDMFRKCQDLISIDVERKLQMLGQNKFTPSPIVQPPKVFRDLHRQPPFPPHRTRALARPAACQAYDRGTK